jgi:hypothetical protein
MALFVPPEGQSGGGVNEYGVARLTAGVIASMPAGYNPNKHVVLGAPTTVALATVEANTLIPFVLSRVKVAFTASYTITIGDGTSAAGFLASADIAPQSAVTTGIMVSSLGAAEAFAGGKTYEASDTIDAVVAAATAVVGYLELFIFFTTSPRL